jgi:hypothetical protein
VVINVCNRKIQETGKYQLKGVDWRTMKPVVEDYFETTSSTKPYMDVTRLRREIGHR